MSAKKGRHHQQRKTHCANGHEFTKENTYMEQGDATLKYDRVRAHRAACCPLHAAAPALLQVAEGALGYLEALPFNARPDEAWLAPLRAAIALARG